MPNVPQIVFGVLVALGLGQLLFIAPAGRLLVSTPPAHHAEKDPSIRVGSSGSHSSWFFWSGGGSGGYHGGK